MSRWWAEATALHTCSNIFITRGLIAALRYDIFDGDSFYPLHNHVREFIVFVAIEYLYTDLQNRLR